MYVRMYVCDTTRDTTRHGTWGWARGMKQVIILLQHQSPINHALLSSHPPSRTLITRSACSRTSQSATERTQRAEFLRAAIDALTKRDRVFSSLDKRCPAGVSRRGTGSAPGSSSPLGGNNMLRASCPAFATSRLIFCSMMVSTARRSLTCVAHRSRNSAAFEHRAKELVQHPAYIHSAEKKACCPTLAPQHRANGSELVVQSTHTSSGACSAEL